MPPLRALLQQQPPPPTGPTAPRPKQGPLTMADWLMTLGAGLAGVNEPQREDFENEEAFQTAARPYAVGTLASVLAPMIGAVTMKAYHGSPHDFEKFSLSKVGTGEGGQAYGHGLYFAENPKVAHEYRKALAYLSDAESRQILEVMPKGFQGPDNVRNVVGQIHDAVANGDIQKPSHFLNEYEVPPPLKAAYEKAGAILDNKGRTYEVNIHASPDELLDWDKPLSQQSAKVQEALKAVLAKEFKNVQPVRLSDGWYSVTNVDSKGVGRLMTSDIKESTAEAAMQRFHEYLDSHSGEALYQRLVEASGGRIGHTEGLAAQKLKEAGIKGIQYLDQGSRAAGEGTRNFVIFDDKIIEIAKKYGISLPVAASLYKWQQSQSPQSGVE